MLPFIIVALALVSLHSDGPLTKTGTPGATVWIGLQCCFLFPKGWTPLATGQEAVKFMGCLRDQVKHRAVGTRMRGQGETAGVLTNSANNVGTPGTDMTPQVCPSLGHNAVAECD